MSGSSRPPRNDDELFAQIVEREFHERVDTGVTPPPAAEAPPPAPAPAPFELNLYDDEESYRHVYPAGFAHLSPIARAGIVALAISVVGGMLLVLGIGAPRWVGYIVAGLFAVACGIGIKQMLRKPDQQDDDGSVV
jgi:hypothetical protein